MILHICLDDKFIDVAYRMFEQAAQGSNDFFVITKKNKFKYITEPSILTISTKEMRSRKFLQKVQMYDAIIVHWLSEIAMEFLNRIDKTIPVLWIGWGGDYCSYFSSESTLFLPETNSLIKEGCLNNESPKRVFFNSFKRFIKEKIYGKTNFRKSVDRINYFAPVIKEDFDLLKGAIPNFNPEFIDWNYGTLEDDLVINEGLFKDENILIGNSATPTNNHLDLFSKLQHIPFEHNLIVPLSYGVEEYKDKVKDKGQQLFGGMFTAVEKFMKKREYIELLSSCSVAIMNHTRQQAMGNIIIMLYLGAKVFLNPLNPAFSHFKRHGLKIFSVNDLSNESLKSKLTEDEIEYNRARLRSIYSREKMIKKTKLLIQKITEKK